MGYYYCRKNKRFITRTLDKEPRDMTNYKVLSEEEYLLGKELLANLDATEDALIKFAGGEMTEMEFQPIKEQRAEWRARLIEIIE